MAKKNNKQNDDRGPDSYRLEWLMIKRLKAAGWSTASVVGWIAAQRSDGVLSPYASDWLVDNQLLVWKQANPDTLDARIHLEVIERAYQVMTEDMAECDCGVCLACQGIAPPGDDAPDDDSNLPFLCV